MIADWIEVAYAEKVQDYKDELSCSPDSNTRTWLKLCCLIEYLERKENKK